MAFSLPLPSSLLKLPNFEVENAKHLANFHTSNGFRHNKKVTGEIIIYCSVCGDMQEELRILASKYNTGEGLSISVTAKQNTA